MVQFHALGALTITENGDVLSIGGPRQRRLVAMLLIHRDAVVSVDRLADAVFAGEPTAGAATTLRSYVARVRKVVDVDRDGSSATVVTRAPGYMLQLSADAFDVTCFEGLLADAGLRLVRDDAAGASSVVREALTLWRGEAYAEFADEDWARPEAQRLEELRLVAHERLVEAELACGHAAEMMPHIEALAAAHPLREAFRAQLMLALYRTGRHADALRVFRDYRQVLVEELGLDPSPALSDLERRVLTHDPTLMLPEPVGLPLRGYRLGERLGTGRDGTVFAGRLAGVERDFAVRVVRPEIADHPEYVRSFEVWAHRVASLRHPAIVAIHDYWREPGAAYVVMRRMHGGTLADRLERGSLTPAALLMLVTRIGGVLEVAAEHGIVHGRVIPESVFFDESGDPYLSDFALSPTHRVSSAGDDVQSFAAMVKQCVSGESELVADVLARGAATADRPPMGEFVPMLIAALGAVGGDAVVDRTPPNPYKGLRAFDEADAADFFGRGDLLDELVARLGGDDLAGRLVLLVGGSGTGKSSLVRAGLLPRIRAGSVPGSREWFVATMLPGSSPFKELAESLRHVAIAEWAGLADQLAEDGGIDRVLRRLVPDGGQLLLVVDQFEELFTLATEQDQRAFLDGVMQAVSAPDSRLHVVATLRADFYDRPLAFQHFGAAMQEVTVPISAMSLADLEAAIVEPAERVRGAVERDLVAELVNAVVDRPAALPSLQFALYELAEQSPDKRLTLAVYRQLGGLSGAIAARAEQLYQSLDDAERAAVRHMFERLVVVSADGEPARRRAARAELSGLMSGPAVDTAIDRWSDARLLTLDRNPQTRGPTVELAHEALLREWPRLRRWIDEDRQAILVLSELREAAGSWIELGRDPGALYRGTRLQVAFDVTEGRVEGLPAQEREFVDASRRARDLEKREAAERVARQARANRRLRIQLGVIAVALVVALVGGFIALDQRRDAERERRVATARELAAASVANLTDDPERSMLLALAAIDETGSDDGSVLPEAEEALHRAVTTSRLLLSVPDVGGALDWSPNGNIFVTEGPEETGVVDIRDVETGASVIAFQGHEVDVNDVAFSGDGSMLATTGDDGAVRVWDPGTGDELLSFEVEHSAQVWGPSFSPDGSRLAAAWPERDLVRVIDIASGAVTAEITAPAPSSTAFSPDGERLVVSSHDQPIAVVLDAKSGEELFTLEGHEHYIPDVTWSPDGRWIATGSEDATARIWDADSGEYQATVAGHTAQVSGVDWSPDSTRLATVSADGTARVTEISAGGTRELLSLAAQDTANGLRSVAFSPSGDQIMTGDYSITAVKIWDVSANGGAEWANLEGARNALSAAFAADSQALAVSSPGGVVTIHDVERGTQLRTIGPDPSGGDLERLAMTADGQLIATSVGPAPARVWDAVTGEHLFEVSTRGIADRWIMDMDWSRDGKLLAIAQTGGNPGQIVIVDRSGTELAAFGEEPEFNVTAVSFSPDGTLLATARRSVRDDRTDAGVKIWDWKRERIVTTLDTSATNVVFDATGTRIATSAHIDGIGEIWDAETGEKLATLVSTSIISDAAFSPDGSSVASAGLDGTVRLWDPETGVQQRALVGDASLFHAVTFSPDGSRLASVGGDGIVRVWAVALDDLIAIANGRLTRSLSDNECRQYLHVERCPDP